MVLLNLVFQFNKCLPLFVRNVKLDVVEYIFCDFNLYVEYFLRNSNKI